MNEVHVRVRVAGEEYALPVSHVLEIAEIGDVTPMPGAPAEILGVRNVRGQVVPVIDVARLFDLTPNGDPGFVVIAESGPRHAALAVEEVLDVMELPPVTRETDSTYLRGAAPTAGALIGVVDLEAVLASQEAA